MFLTAASPSLPHPTTPPLLTPPLVSLLDPTLLASSPHHSPPSLLTYLTHNSCPPYPIISLIIPPLLPFSTSNSSTAHTNTSLLTPSLLTFSIYHSSPPNTTTIARATSLPGDENIHTALTREPTLSLTIAVETSPNLPLPAVYSLPSCPVPVPSSAVASLPPSLSYSPGPHLSSSLLPSSPLPYSPLSPPLPSSSLHSSPSYTPHLPLGGGSR